MQTITVSSPDFASFTIPCQADGFGRCHFPKVRFSLHGRTFVTEVEPNGRLHTDPAIRRAFGFVGLTEENAIVR